MRLLLQYQKKDLLTISKERFEDFIAPFLNDDEYELATRPREGDLIFFPLGTRLFEVKFVEHEQPFYQLGKNYVYVNSLNMRMRSSILVLMRSIRRLKMKDSLQLSIL